MGEKKISFCQILKISHQQRLVLKKSIVEGVTL